MGKLNQLNGQALTPLGQAINWNSKFIPTPHGERSIWILFCADINQIWDANPKTGGAIK